MKSYKIVDFNESTAQMTIKYKDFPLIKVDLPIDNNGNIISGEDLQNYIKGFIPVWHEERKELIKNGINNLNDIKSLIEYDEDYQKEIHEQENIPYYNKENLNPSFLPTQPEIIVEMLRLASLKNNDVLFDLGSGEGDIIIAASKLGAKAIGIEKDSTLVNKSIIKAAENNVVIEVREEDMFEADLSEASVITICLNQPSLNLLAPKLYSLKSGTRIVSDFHNITWWKPKEVKRINDTLLFLWVVE